MKPLDQVAHLKMRVGVILRKRDKTIPHPTAERYEKETMTMLRRYLKTGSIYKPRRIR